MKARLPQGYGKQSQQQLMQQVQQMQEQQQIQSLWRKCKIPVNKRGQEEWQMFYHKAR